MKMVIGKQTSYKLPIRFGLILLTLGILMAGSGAIKPVSAQSIPAGCVGSTQQGPPSAGTVCPDGSVPVKDPSLPIGCPGSSQQGPVGQDYTVVCPARPGRAECTYKQSTQQCEPAPSSFKTDCKDASINSSNCGIIKYLLLFINGLSAIVGIVIVIVIIVGGIQYSAAGDNPQGTEAAKKRISSAIIALLLYIFTFAFLQWIVPGGIF